MTRWWLVLGGVGVSVAAALPGCSSSDDGPAYAPNMNAGGLSSAGGAPGVPGGGGALASASGGEVAVSSAGGATCTPVTTDPKYPANNCNNVADKCLFETHASLAYDLGSKCATSDCIQYAVQPDSPDARKCFVDCFKKQITAQTGQSVSDACASCSDAVVICGAMNCLSGCINDPHSPTCLSCLCSQHDRAGKTAGSCLIDEYAECAGFAPTPELVGCTGLTGGAGGGPAAGGGTGAGGTDGLGGSAGAVAAGGSGPVTEITGCGTTKLLSSPADTSARGPWPVGTRTVKFGRFAAVEVMYPATPGSADGKQAVQYDLRSWLPQSEQSKVPDSEAKQVTADSFQDLPLDATHGPYPLVILVHGTGAFRVASGLTQSQWASRGFVVVAAEHPNLYLTDMLKSGCGQGTSPALDLSGDVDSEIAALTSPAGDLAFLAGHVDVSRIALAGHSAGAFNVAQFSGKPNVQVVIPLSGTHSVSPSGSLKSVAFVGGMADTVLPYATGAGVGSLLYPGTQTTAYQQSPGPPVKKRLTGITGAGHLAVTDLCQVNSQGKNAIQVAQAHGVCGLGILPSLFDCGTIDRLKGTQVVNDITTAVLEETLQCQDRTALISSLKSRYSQVGDFQESK